MDPERRPDSDETALYSALRKTPEFLRDYGAYVVLALAVLVAGFWVYRTRSQSAQMEQQAATQGLYNMVNLVEQAQQLASLTPVMSPSQVQEQVADLDAQFQQFSPLVADSPVEGAVAHALRLRGDFTWTLGIMPPGMADEPATRPTTGPAGESDISSLLNSGGEGSTVGATEPRESGEWLEESAAAYQQVLDRFPRQHRDVIAARFGLAAIAEQQGEFDAASEQYEAIIAMENVPESVASLARERDELLEYLALEVRLAPPATRPTTGPTTNPISGAAAVTPPATQPSTPPTTVPATQPAP